MRMMLFHYKTQEDNMTVEYLLKENGKAVKRPSTLCEWRKVY